MFKTTLKSKTVNTFEEYLHYLLDIETWALVPLKREFKCVSKQTMFTGLFNKISPFEIMRNLAEIPINVVIKTPMFPGDVEATNIDIQDIVVEITLSESGIHIQSDDNCVEIDTDIDVSNYNILNGLIKGDVFFTFYFGIKKATARHHKRHAMFTRGKIDRLNNSYVLQSIRKSAKYLLDN